MTRHATHLDAGGPLLRGLCLVVKSHRPNHDQRHQPTPGTVTKYPRRPDAGVLSKSIPLFFIGRTNAMAHTIELTKDAEAAGAVAILSVVPYNKPTQAGLYAHFRTIAESTGLPVILYDVPSRTACGLADETIARLAELPRTQCFYTFHVRATSHFYTE
jgi:Dihydrodipicolinate synthetase family